MVIRFFGGFATAWRTLDKTFLDQEWFVYFFECTWFFTNSCCNSGDTNRTAFEFFDNGRKKAVVHIVQAMLVNIQGTKAMLGNAEVDRSIIQHLCKVAH